MPISPLGNIHSWAPVYSPTPTKAREDSEVVKKTGDEINLIKYDTEYIKDTGNLPPDKPDLYGRYKK